MVLLEATFFAFHLSDIYPHVRKRRMRIARRGPKCKLSATRTPLSRAAGKQFLQLGNAFFKRIDLFHCSLYSLPFRPQFQGREDVI